MITVGEGAVVAYVLSRGTVGANDSGSDKDSDTEVAAVTDKACEKIPQDSQIDTSTALSQNIIAQLFGSESDTDTSSSHQHVIGAFQLLLSGAKSNRDVDADVNLLASEVFLNAYETVDSSGSKDSEVELMDEEFIKALGGTLTLEVMDKNAL
ncbi:hypothetical protein JG687_00016873 [Phytophthora cactorum]|uniref:Uncharacterized protein n=1 Tax=Phytophthora cactorum TaxID=29920 RepID=A0A8T1TTD8_9STRA|nr:hypothetical protein JG687_00016873 [Phytophthora cactorum]